VLMIVLGFITVISAHYATETVGTDLT